MRTFKKIVGLHHRGMGALLLLLLILLTPGLACKSGSPTSANGTALRTGNTSAGRKFSIFLEDTDDGSLRLRLRIDGEEELVISEVPTYYGEDLVRSALAHTAESLQIFEYSGTVDLIHIDWRDTDLWNLRSYTYYNYYAAPVGGIATALLTGRNVSAGVGHYAFDWGSGSYEIIYVGNILDIIEDQRAGREGDSCYLEETHLERSYRVVSGNPASVELLSCGERYRTAQLASWTNTCMGDPDLETAIQQAPWATANFSPDDAARKCAALQ